VPRTGFLNQLTRFPFLKTLFFAFQAFNKKNNLYKIQTKVRRSRVRFSRKNSSSDFWLKIQKIQKKGVYIGLGFLLCGIPISPFWRPILFTIIFLSFHCIQGKPRKERQVKHSQLVCHLCYRVNYFIFLFFANTNAGFFPFPFLLVIGGLLGCSFLSTCSNIPGPCSALQL